MREIWLRRGNPSVRFDYVVENDKLIYFTALQRSPSSINVAENIIERICEQENIDWKEYTFYDIQTTLGYPHRLKSGAFNIDRLSLSEEDETPRVTNWIPVIPDKELEPISSDPVNGIPAEIIAGFSGYILSEKNPRSMRQ